jgi:hypothetical protein
MSERKKEGKIEKSVARSLIDKSPLSAKGRVAESFVSTHPTSQYQPKVNADKNTQDAIKIIRDNTYKLRKEYIDHIQEIEDPAPPLEVSTTTEVSNIFNEDDDGGIGAPLGTFYIEPNPWIIGNMAIATTSTVTANRVVCLLHLLVSDITIHTVVAECFGTDPLVGAKLGIGWYKYETSRLVWQSGAIDVETNGVKRQALAEPVLVEAGMYWQAWTASGGASKTYAGFNLANSLVFQFLNSGTRRYGAGAGGAAGILPDDLPTLIDPVALENPIYSLFELV